jgi:hypothetical protein
MSDMTKADRDELRRVVRMRAKVAHNGIEARRAELLADFEAQMAAKYDFDDARWSEITATAATAIREGDRQIADICGEVGIPEEFRPRLALSWRDRGENAVAGRRAELRKVAATRLDALAKAAKVSIDRAELDACTDLAAGALQTDEARAWLERQPTIDQLMPPLDLAEMEARRRAGEGALDWKERPRGRWEGPKLPADLELEQEW